MRSAAVGKAARLSIYWQDVAYRLIIPERQVEFGQLYKYKISPSKRRAANQSESSIKVKNAGPNIDGPTIF